MHYEIYQPKLTKERAEQNSDEPIIKYLDSRTCYTDKDKIMSFYYKLEEGDWDFEYKYLTDVLKFVETYYKDRYDRERKDFRGHVIDSEIIIKLDNKYYIHKKGNFYPTIDRGNWYPTDWYILKIPDEEKGTEILTKKDKTMVIVVSLLMTLILTVICLAPIWSRFNEPEHYCHKCLSDQIYCINMENTNHSYIYEYYHCKKCGCKYQIKRSVNNYTKKEVKVL